MANLNLVGGSYPAASPAFDSQRCINLIPEASESGTSKTIAFLYGSPGLTVPLVTLAGTTGVRGCLRFSPDVAVVVVGGNVYKVNTAFVGTLIGVIDVGTTPVSMASNGLVVMLVTGPKGYTVDPIAGTVVEIVSAAFSGADRVDFIDQFFVFNKPGTGLLQITGLGTTTIDPLDFASAEGAPDLLLAPLVNNLEVWLFGGTSVEIFFNSGNADFPLQRIQGAFIQQGCAAKLSPQKIGGNIFWLTADESGQGMVAQAQGYGWLRISTHAVETAISKYSRIDDAIGLTYQKRGHTFYALIFPTGNWCWTYDLSTKLWHERMWRNPADASYNRPRPQCLMAFAGKIVVGDWENGNLYEWSDEQYTDNGNPLLAIRVTPTISQPDNALQFFGALWVDVEAGVGLSGVGQGTDPQLLVDWSHDGGVSFPADTYHAVPLGKIGERKRRARVRRGGKGYQRTYRFTIADPVKRVMLGADVEIELEEATA